MGEHNRTEGQNESDEKLTINRRTVLAGAGAGALNLAGLSGMAAAQSEGEPVVAGCEETARTERFEEQTISGTVSDTDYEITITQVVTKDDGEVVGFYFESDVPVLRVWIKGGSGDPVPNNQGGDGVLSGGPVYAPVNPRNQEYHGVSWVKFELCLDHDDEFVCEAGESIGRNERFPEPGETFSGTVGGVDYEITIGEVFYKDDTGEAYGFSWTSNVPLYQVRVKGGTSVRTFEFEPVGATSGEATAPINSRNNRYFGISYFEFFVCV